MKSLKKSRLAQLTNGSFISVMMDNGKKFSGSVTGNDGRKSLEILNEYGEILVTGYKNISSFIIYSTEQRIITPVSAQSESAPPDVPDNMSNEKSEPVSENSPDIISMSDPEPEKPQEALPVNPGAADDRKQTETQKVKESEPDSREKFEKQEYYRFFKNDGYVTAPPIHETYMSSLYTNITDKRLANQYFSKFIYGLKNNDISKCRIAAAQFDQNINRSLEDNSVLILLANMHAYSGNYEEAASLFRFISDFYSSSLYSYLSDNYEAALADAQRFIMNQNGCNYDFIIKIVYILVRSTIITNNCYSINYIFEALAKLLKDSSVTVENCYDYILGEKGIYNAPNTTGEKMKLVKEIYDSSEPSREKYATDYPRDTMFGYMYTSAGMTYSIIASDQSGTFIFEKPNSSKKLLELLASEPEDLTSVYVSFTPKNEQYAQNVEIFSLVGRECAELADSYVSAFRYSQALMCYFCAMRTGYRCEEQIINCYRHLIDSENPSRYVKAFRKFLSEYCSNEDDELVLSSYLSIYLRTDEYSNAIIYFDKLTQCQMPENKKLDYLLAKAEFQKKHGKYADCLNTAEFCKEMCKTSGSAQNKIDIDNMISECCEALKPKEPLVTAVAAESEEPQTPVIQSSMAIEEKLNIKPKKKNKSKEKAVSSSEEKTEYLLPSDLGISDESYEISFKSEHSEASMDEKMLTSTLKKYFSATGADSMKFLLVVHILDVMKICSDKFLRKSLQKLISDPSNIEYITDHLYDYGLTDRIIPDSSYDADSKYYKISKAGEDYFSSKKFSKAFKSMEFNNSEINQFTLYSFLACEKLFTDVLDPLNSKYLVDSSIIQSSYFFCDLMKFNTPRSQKSFLHLAVIVPVNTAQTDPDTFRDEISILVNKIKSSLTSSSRTSLLVYSENFSCEWMTVFSDALTGILNRYNIYSFTNQGYITTSNMEELSSEEFTERICSNQLPPDQEIIQSPVISEEESETAEQEKDTEFISEDTAETKETDMQPDDNDEQIPDDEYDEDELYFSFLNGNDDYKADPKQFSEDIKKMTETGQFACALTYAKAVSEQDAMYTSFYRTLSMALDNPAEDCIYTSSEVFSITGNISGVDESLYEHCLASSELRALFFNGSDYDYTVNTFADSLKSRSISKTYPEITELTDIFTEYRKIFGSGICSAADICSSSDRSDKSKINEITDRAKRYYTVYSNTGESMSNLKVKTYKALMFSEKNELLSRLRIVTENRTEEAEDLAVFVKNNFLKEKSDIISSNISSDKISAYIEHIWSEAGILLKKRGKSVSTGVELIGNVRTHSELGLRKISGVMCDWLGCTGEEFSQTNEDALNYFNSKLPEMEELLRTLITKSSSSHETYANILKTTFTDIYNRLHQKPDPTAAKYYFSDFLTNSYVHLDNNFIPVTSSSFLSTDSLNIINRIRNHSEEPSYSFEDRINTIFSKDPLTQDYGTAVLIDKYLNDTDPGRNILKDYSDSLEKYISYSRNQSLKRKNKLNEDAQLFYVRGEIDVLTRDTVIKTAAIWYKKSCLSDNYGFFFKITDALENYIYTSAQKTECFIKAKYDAVKMIPAAPDDIETAGRLISERNYPLAEYTLNRICSCEESKPLVLSSPDIINDFHRQYDSIYRKCIDSNVRLEIALSKSGYQNTDGSSKVIENWISGSMISDTGKLEDLFRALGWNNISIKFIGKTDRDTERFSADISGDITETASALPFTGSDFDILCVYSKYEPQQLIRSFLSADCSRDTLVLIDYALTMNERNMIASEIRKNQDITGVFAFADRTAITYTADNYDSSTVNNKFLSVVMPFSGMTPFHYHIMPDFAQTDNSECIKYIYDELNACGIWSDSYETLYEIPAVCGCFNEAVRYCCQKIADIVRDEENSSTVSPPFTITSYHIRKAVSDQKLRELMVSEFYSLLELKTDDENSGFQRVSDSFAVAAVIAYLCYKNPDSCGFTADEFIICADTNGIERFNDYDYENIVALFDELCRKGILVKYPENRYNFRFGSYLSLIGTVSELEEVFVNNIG